MPGSRRSSACLGIPSSPWQTMGWGESPMGIGKYWIMILFNVQQRSIILYKIRIIVIYSVLQLKCINGLLSTFHSLTSHPITSIFFWIRLARPGFELPTLGIRSTLPSIKLSSYQSQSIPAAIPGGSISLLANSETATSPCICPASSHSLEYARYKQSSKDLLSEQVPKSSSILHCRVLMQSEP
jgi:hypothetical protein